MLFVDAHRPSRLDKMDFHPEVSSRLIRLSQSNEFPHLLIYGPSGVGKKTRILALLRELYGNGVNKVRFEHKNFKPNGTSTKIEITTVSSNYHIEMNPSDVGNKDRFVVQEVLKEMASYHLMDTKTTTKKFKVVLLMEVDRLSKAAQHALRRTMEKYSTSCRLILCCNSPSKVIDPIKSRCVGIRVAAPTVPEIVTILNGVCKKEGIRPCEILNERIAVSSRRNLRRSLLMLETAVVQHRVLSPESPLLLPEWEEAITLLMKTMLREQSPASLLQVRESLYNLLSNCIPPEMILKTFLKQVLPRMDDEMKPAVIHWAAYYEHRLQTGSKAIFHLEAFAAKFMQIYRTFLIDMYG